MHVNVQSVSAHVFQMFVRLNVQLSLLVVSYVFALSRICLENCVIYSVGGPRLSMPLWSELLTYFCWRDICVEQHLSAIMSAVVLCCHIFSIDYTPTIQHGPVWLGNFSVLRVKEMLTAIGVNFGGAALARVKWTRFLLTPQPPLIWLY